LTDPDAVCGNNTTVVNSTEMSLIPRPRFRSAARTETAQVADTLTNFLTEATTTQEATPPLAAPSQAPPSATRSPPLSTARSTPRFRVPQIEDWYTTPAGIAANEQCLAEYGITVRERIAEGYRQRTVEELAVAAAEEARAQATHEFMANVRRLGGTNGYLNSLGIATHNLPDDHPLIAAEQKETELSDKVIRVCMIGTSELSDHQFELMGGVKGGISGSSNFSKSSAWRLPLERDVFSLESNQWRAVESYCQPSEAAFVWEMVLRNDFLITATVRFL
jgi:hypothetical protein